MMNEPYSRFKNDTLILRDELAIDRTLLANERTLLAYLRSAVALLIAGATIMKFSSQDWFWWVGVACLPTGIITGVIGVVRHWQMNRSINCIRNMSPITAGSGLEVDPTDRPEPD